MLFPGPAHAHRAAGAVLRLVRSRKRGRAAAALADSPSAIFYNPANITRLSGLQLNLGMAVLMPRWKYVPLDGQASGATSNVSVVTPPSFSLTYNFGNFGYGDVAAGLGFYAPYGSSFSWPSDWAGRQQVQQMTLQVFEISPVVAWRPHEMVTIGAGLRIMPASVYLKQAVDFGDQAEGEAQLAGTGTGIGASAGVTVMPTEGLALALTWRGPATIRLTGESDFDFPPPFDTKAFDDDVETKLPLAQVLRLGVAYDVMPKTLNVSADLEYQMWSTYKSLSLTFLDAQGNVDSRVTPNPKVQERNAANCWVLHLGAEYRLLENVAVRAGYVYDSNVLPEKTVNPAPPNSDLQSVTIGGSYYFKQFGVHAHFVNMVTLSEFGIW